MKRLTAAAYYAGIAISCAAVGIGGWALTLLIGQFLYAAVERAAYH